MLLTILLGLTAAVCWGAPDVWLAQATRNLGPFPVAFGAILIGLIQAFNEGLSAAHLLGVRIPGPPGSDWTQSIVFAILILILVFRPEGLLGERTPEGG